MTRSESLRAAPQDALTYQHAQCSSMSLSCSLATEWTALQIHNARGGRAPRAPLAAVDPESPIAPAREPAIEPRGLEPLVQSVLQVWQYHGLDS